jgi:ubiquinone/menaquinone biosynthesis C-methylase UbiE
MEFTGERLVTDIKGQIAIEHLHRYAIAAELCKGKTVLDIASGEGYGSNLLSKSANIVKGVDISEEAVIHAARKYTSSNLEFRKGSVLNIPFEDSFFDVVISFETLEHIVEHELMLKEVKRVLKPDGLFIVSTPNKLYYSDKTNHKNEYHHKELYFEEFEALLKPFFKTQKFYFQNFFNGSLVFSNNNTFNPILFSGDYVHINNEGTIPNTFILAFCSNIELPEINNSIYEDKKLYYGVEGFFNKKIEIVYNSRSYKLGYLLLTPFRIILSLFR